MIYKKKFPRLRRLLQRREARKGGPGVDGGGVLHVVTYPVQNIGGRGYGGHGRDGRRGRMDVPEVDVWGVVHVVTYPAQDVGGRNYGGYSRDGRRGRVDRKSMCGVWCTWSLTPYKM